ncbi:hypothetical protein CTRI78_v008779 [Colletotrichum trifolii]|uniref:Integral membrane protein n=1 Tax=Colletotrichum trifolii TaxID=5466 RepID=A0A4R8QSC2_COLTR|nr:hypothetical protein CTRI78_v008779 [Colletotrichum trifolii]
MSHQPSPLASRSSRPQTKSSGDVAPTACRGPSTLAAPKPVRPVQNLLQPPSNQWTNQTQNQNLSGLADDYTSFPPPPSPVPNAGTRPSPLPSRVSSGTPSSVALSALNSRAKLNSPGPGALTSFPPPPPTPPERNAPGYFNQAPSPAAPTAARTPSKLQSVVLPGELSPTSDILTPPGNSDDHVHIAHADFQPGVFDIDNLEESLYNLRFAPSPMLSTIYSCPSTPRDELATPDFTSSTTSCLTRPSTNPTPELDLTPRAPPTAPKETTVVVPPPTRPRANSRRASPPTRNRGRGLVVSCIDSPVTFATTWYTHPTAPDFTICSRCYEDHLLGTRFEHDFRGKTLDDHKPRVCRFSQPRIKDHLLQQALITGRVVDDLTAFLRRRSTIADCRGLDGVHGSDKTKWFRPKHNAVPNMVVCEACYEDHILPFRAASNFEPTPAQPANDVWTCDMAIPYIQTIYRQHAAAAASSSWTAFTKDASTRMSLPSCAKRQRVAVGSRTWFTPIVSSPAADTNNTNNINNINDILVCAACHADYIVTSCESHNWHPAGASDATSLASRYGSMVHCALGHFNMSVAASRARQTHDASVFYRALAAMCREPLCDPLGTPDAAWYTFPSHPEQFAICAACVACVAEPLGLAASLVPKCGGGGGGGGGVAPGSKLVCALNPGGSPRFGAYMTKLLEGFYVADTRALERYALEFANLPPCPRDEDFTNRRWYGWKGCAVCPACYHEFVARGSPLAGRMELRGDTVAGSLMCEMYSPRMRALYAEACERSDESGLLEAARARRAVYAETVPVMRQMVMEAQNQQVSKRSSGTFRMTGFGYGSLNRYEVEGSSSYGTQTGSIVEFGSGTRALVFGQLEKRWREVE